MPTNNRDSKNITLKDMCRLELIKVDDILIYKRNFSASKVVVDLSMQVIKVAPSGQVASEWPCTEMMNSMLYTNFRLLKQVGHRVYQSNLEVRFMKTSKPLLPWKQKSSIIMDELPRKNVPMETRSKV